VKSEIRSFEAPIGRVTAVGPLAGARDCRPDELGANGLIDLSWEGLRGRSTHAGRTGTLFLPRTGPSRSRPLVRRFLMGVAGRQQSAVLRQRKHPLDMGFEGGHGQIWSHVI
jgi:hypothetical protein